MDIVDAMDSNPCVSGTESGGSTPPPAAKSPHMWGLFMCKLLLVGGSLLLVQPWCNRKINLPISLVLVCWCNGGATSIEFIETVDIMDGFVHKFRVL